MSAFASLSDLAPLPIWNGVLGRAVQGANITMGVLELAPNSVVPEHHHPNEQLGVVLKGSMTFTIGSERRDLAPGDMYTIPANMPHGVVTGPEGAVVIDVFSPVRADWSRFEPLTPCPPHWP
jgi:quercetin dioxygenase-like cupin family protein